MKKKQVLLRLHWIVVFLFSMPFLMLCILFKIKLMQFFRNYSIVCLDKQYSYNIMFTILKQDFSAWSINDVPSLLHGKEMKQAAFINWKCSFCASFEVIPFNNTIYIWFFVKSVFFYSYYWRSKCSIFSWISRKFQIAVQF